MKNFSTWLLVMFMLMFWAFRVMVAVAAQLHWDFAFTPLNLDMEIALLFIVLACVVLVVKRKVAGGLIYFLSYGMYFGIDIYNNVNQIMGAVDAGTLTVNNYTNLFISFLGMFLAIAVLFDLLMDKNRKAHPTDEKTDFFYKNEKFDRQLDERADKNNYRTM